MSDAPDEALTPLVDAVMRQYADMDWDRTTDRATDRATDMVRIWL